MTLAKDERMLGEWRKCQAENAALWEFVRARDAFNAMMDSGDWDGGDDVYDAMTATRDALRKYEQE